MPNCGLRMDSGSILTSRSLIGILKTLSIRSGTRSLRYNQRFLPLRAQISQNLLEFRKSDGSSTTITYLARNSPGLWRRTPSLYRPPEQPHWRKVSLYTLPDRHSFLPSAPPDPQSPEFIHALREVKEVGGKISQIRTEEEGFIARFWKDFSYSQTPPGHWNDIATFVAKSQKMNAWEESRMFALMNTAMADAGIIAWESKYKYHLWRPVHAIRLADQFPKLEDW